MSLRGRALAVMAAAALAASAAGARAQADEAALAAQGALAFQGDLGCGNCHFKDSAFAPPLDGVAGRKIGTAPGFLYSAAMKSKGGAWTDANLDAFLANPQTFAPGTGMDVSVADVAQRRAVIAYLKTLK